MKNVIDDGSGHTKSLTFHGCANIRHSMDFGVVASNFLAVVHKASATADTEKMEKFVNGHRKHWRSIDMPPYPKDFPLMKKSAAGGSFALFEVNFHGGTILGLAKRFSFRSEK